MSEKRNELESELSSAASEANTWKQLLEHPAWKRYEAFLREQQAMRAQVCMLTPISTEYSAFAQELFKGEYGGIGLALAIPQTQFELADLRRKALTQELENFDETEKRMDTENAGIFGGSPFGE